jgi:Ras association domain-containing protein 1
MCTSVKPPSLYDCSAANETGGHEKTHITSFYLPKHTTTVIHVSSETSTQEVIQTLLSKFKITDNPRKFALYEKNQEQGKSATMRRMGESETPLPILLHWADAGLQNLECNKFVLQENDAGEIIWDEFSLPELDNFLCVLNREEEEYIDQVKTKYRILRIQILKRLGDKRSPVFV